MKIKYYVVFKIIYKSGKTQRISGYSSRIEDKIQMDDLISELMEIIKTTYKEGDPAYLNVDNQYVNIAATSYIKIIKKSVFW